MTITNIPANNCRLNLNSLRHVKPWRPDLSPEQAEIAKLKCYERMANVDAQVKAKAERDKRKALERRTKLKRQVIGLKAA